MPQVGLLQRTSAGKYLALGVRTASVRPSTGPLFFNGVQYDRGDTLRMTTKGPTPVFAVKDVVEYPRDTGQYWAVESVVLDPPAFITAHYVAVRYTEPGGLTILERVTIDGEPMTVGGDEVFA